MQVTSGESSTMCGPQALPVRHRSPAQMLYRAGQILGMAIAFALVAAVGIFFLAPYLWMVFSSLKNFKEAFTGTPHWLPQKWEWSNYPRSLTDIPFFLYMRNSLIVCTGTVIGTLLSSSITAYSISRMRWWGRTPLFIVVLMTMMLPYQVTMIPLFIIFRRLGWVGTYLPLIIPSFFGSSFFIFLLRQFFLTIPEELLDAARVDGAGDLRIFWAIVLPVSRAVLATVAVFTFLFTWNDFLGPLIYLTNDKMWTLAIGLRGYQSMHGMQWEELMAASTIFTLPVVLVYLVGQRWLVRSIVTTGFR